MVYFTETPESFPHDGKYFWCEMKEKGVSDDTLGGLWPIFSDECSAKAVKKDATIWQFKTWSNFMLVKEASCHWGILSGN